MSSDHVRSISVIIPTYMHERFIAQTLDSVLAQTRPSCEVIVVNDGSPDDTDAAVAPYLGRITYLKQANTGVSSALNRGMTVAFGDYLLFIASDDWLCPDALEKLAQPLDNHPDVGLSYGEVFMVDEAGRPSPETFPRRTCRRVGKHDASEALIMGNFIPAMATLVRSSAARAAGAFAEYPYSQDWALWLQIALRRWLFFGVSDQVAYYRRHAGNTSRGSNELAILEDAIKMLRSSGKRRHVSHDDLTPLFRRSIAAYESRLAWIYLDAGRAKDARRTYFRVLGTPNLAAAGALGLILSFLPGSVLEAVRQAKRRWGRGTRRRQAAAGSGASRDRRLGRPIKAPRPGG